MNKHIIDLIKNISLTIFILFTFIFSNKSDRIAYKPAIVGSALVFLTTSWLNFFVYNEFHYRSTFTGHDAIFVLSLISIAIAFITIYLLKK